MTHKFFWNTCGNLSNCFIQLFLLTYLTYQQGLQSAGLFALSWAIVAPVFNFFGMQIRGVIATDMKHIFSLSHYKYSIYLNNFIGMGIVFLISLLFINSPLMSICIMIMGLSKAIENLADIDYGFYQKINRHDCSGQSLAGKNILLALMLILCLSIELHYVHVAWLYLLSRTLMLIMNYFRVKSLHHKSSNILNIYSFDRNIWLNFLKMVYPMGLVVLMVTFSQTLPRLLLGVYYDENLIAIYSNALAFFLVVVTLTNSIGQMHMTRLSRYFYRERYQFFLKMIVLMFSQVTALIVLIQFIIVLFGENILSFILNEQSAQYFKFFEMMFLAVAIQCFSFVVDYILTSIRQFKWLAGKQMVVFILTTPILWLLIKQDGLMGAAYGLIICSVLQLVCASILLFWFWGGALIVHGRKKYPVMHDVYEINSWKLRVKYLRNHFRLNRL